MRHRRDVPAFQLKCSENRESGSSRRPTTRWRCFLFIGNTRPNYNEGTGRIDYNISPSQRLFARAFLDYFDQPASGVPGNILSYSFSNPVENYNGAVGHTWIVNPKIVNVATFFLNQIDTLQTGQAIQGNGQPFCWSGYIGVKDPTCSSEGFSVGNGFSSYSTANVLYPSFFRLRIRADC